MTTTTETPDEARGRSIFEARDRCRLENSPEAWAAYAAACAADEAARKAADRRWRQAYRAAARG